MIKNLIIFIIILLIYINSLFYFKKSSTDIINIQYEFNNFNQFLNDNIPFFLDGKSLFNFNWDDNQLNKYSLNYLSHTDNNNFLSFFNHTSNIKFKDTIFNVFPIHNLLHVPFFSKTNYDLFISKGKYTSPIFYSFSLYNIFFVHKGEVTLNIYNKQSLSRDDDFKPVFFIGHKFKYKNISEIQSDDFETTKESISIPEKSLFFVPYNTPFSIQSKDNSHTVIQSFYCETILNNIINIFNK